MFNILYLIIYITQQIFKQAFLLTTDSWVYDIFVCTVIKKFKVNFESLECQLN